jgi:hypothetical protein
MKADSRSRSITARYAAGLVVLGAVYVAAAKFGIEQPVAHGVITPVQVSPSRRS